MPIWKFDDPDAWQAAADFTRDRERQIAETREDIAWVEAQIWADSEHDSPTNSDAPKRILAMLNAKLEMLTRGMKQEAGKSDE